MSNKSLISYLIFLFTLKIINPVLAQERSDLITLELDKVLFKTIKDSIEIKTKYHFYFTDPALDTLVSSMKVTHAPIDSVLEIIFKKTDFNYSIDFRSNIFIVSGKKVVTSIPQDFYNSTMVLPEKKYDAESSSEKEKTVSIQATLENKVLTIGQATNDLSGIVQISGTIKDFQNGEAVIGAVIMEEEAKAYAVSDAFGFYTISIKKGKHILNYHSTSMKSTRRNIVAYSNGTINIEMNAEVQSLTEVVVEKERRNNVSGLQMGQDRLTIKAIKQIPMVFGEADILRAILLLPGVKTVGEASTGFNVRGGSTDQNLILFNDGTIYNPSHLFGFFSSFNPDLVKSVELYKSNIPAKFGGRLSSVLDIAGRDGNKKKFSGSGGIGLLTGRLTLEGPIVKDKASFITGGRSTYSNWLLNALKNSAYSGSRASFYDFNLGLNYEVNSNNSLYLTGYISKDAFRLKKDTNYSYSNHNLILKWKKIFSNKFNSVFTSAYSKYQYAIESNGNPVNGYKLSFDIQQLNIKADQTFYLSNKHTLEFGLNSTFYKIHPGSYLPYDNASKVAPDILQNEQGWENAIYLNDKYEVNQRLSFQLGLRYSLFTYLGQKNIYTYSDNVPKSEYTVKDSINYSAGSFIRTYHGPEYRASVRYMVTENFAVKASFNTLRQYIHMLSNTMAISPTDIWKLSDPNISPTSGNQLSVGLYKNFLNNRYEFSVEGYHKSLKNYLDYKGGAVLLQNHTIERDVISTIGKSYGMEVYLKKLTGKLNGWVSYTFARSLLKMNDPTVGTPVNKGNWYPSNYDKPHDFTFVGNYKFSHRFNLSLNVTYSTGRPITLPLSIYNYAGSARIVYGERNANRIPDYFRMDFSVNVEGNHKIKKLSHGSWTFAVYNLTGRRNTYSVYFKSENGTIKGHKLSIFGQPIPTITYNFKF